MSGSGTQRTFWKFWPIQGVHHANKGSVQAALPIFIAMAIHDIWYISIKRSLLGGGSLNTMGGASPNDWVESQWKIGMWSRNLCTASCTSPSVKVRWRCFNGSFDATNTVSSSLPSEKNEQPRKNWLKLECLNVCIYHPRNLVGFGRVAASLILFQLLFVLVPRPISHQLLTESLQTLPEIAVHVNLYWICLSCFLVALLKH
jgi:hypothetical protein